MGMAGDSMRNESGIRMPVCTRLTLRIVSMRRSWDGSEIPRIDSSLATSVRFGPVSTALRSDAPDHFAQYSPSVVDAAQITSASFDARTVLKNERHPASRERAPSSGRHPARQKVRRCVGTQQTIRRTLQSPAPGPWANRKRPAARFSPHRAKCTGRCGRPPPACQPRPRWHRC